MADYYETWIEDVLLHGLTPQELFFWHGITKSEITNVFCSCRNWLYADLEYYSDVATKTCKSLGLLLKKRPDLLYSSNRPLANMNQFKVTETLDASVRQYFNYIPVTRYGEETTLADGVRISKGKYHTHPHIHSVLNKQDCLGTYYYNEEESETFLAYHTSLIFRNKYEAATWFLGRPKVERWTEEEHVFSFTDNETTRHTRLTITPAYKTYLNRKLHNDLLYTATEAARAFPKLFSGRIPPRNKESRKRYLGVFLGLYAVEDGLDDLLCLAARKKGIDIIILTEMVGSHQLVREVLDTRPRLVSYRHLVQNS
jgi:hypothetical protein